MNEDKENLSSSGPWWKPGMEMFSEVTLWIAGPIVLALIVGKHLDSRFDTKPWIFLSLALLGFLISCWSILRTVKKYVNKIKK